MNIYEKNSGVYDVAIIGAGAAGLMAGAKLAAGGKKIILIEKNEKPGRKLFITGKGRCNLTNNCSTDDFLLAVIRGKKFMQGAINTLNPQDLMEYFESLGVSLKTERGSRVYPASDKSGDIVAALVNEVSSHGAKIINGSVKKLEKENGRYIIALGAGGSVEAENVVIATGGVSYPKTGSTGDGYTFAKSFGHEIIQPKPSLVGLEMREGFCTDMMGLSLKNVKLSLYKDGKKKPVFSDMGEMLFAHYGASGPLILTASAFLSGEDLNKYHLSLDWKPALSNDVLDKRLQSDFLKNTNKSFQNSLSELLPSKSIDVFVKLSEINPDKKVNQISKLEREKLLSIFKDMRLHPKKLRPVDEAVVTAGGVSLKEINPKTMESKLAGGLYIVGELLDIDALTGGFNLQIAFSTATAAAVAIIDKGE